MEDITQYLISHQDVALPLMILMILGAGVGFPMSIDITLIILSVIAVEMAPIKIGVFFTAFSLSCIASASLAYWVGRVGGSRLKEMRFFKGMLSDKRLEKVQKYYDRYGMRTVFFVRFIPFGARNVVYYTSGFFRVPYFKFLLTDFVACFLWAGIFFSIFYSLSQNLEEMITTQKQMNLIIFLAFSVTVIGIICYKVMKRKKSISS